MFEIIKQAIKAGNATVKYPFAPLPTIPDMRGKPEHVPDKCIACAACAIACPPNAIEMIAHTEIGAYTWKIDYGRCIFCARCEEVCPTRAIELGSQFELAVMSADDLISTATFELERCACCGKYFAPRKQVDYAARALMSALGTDDAEYKQAVELMHWCSSCKAKRDAGVLTEGLENAYGHVIEGEPPVLEGASYVSEAMRMGAGSQDAFSMLNDMKNAQVSVADPAAVPVGTAQGASASIAASPASAEQPSVGQTQPSGLA